MNYSIFITDRENIVRHMLGWNNLCLPFLHEIGKLPRQRKRACHSFDRGLGKGSITIPEGYQ
uniref:Uncharacterized protein n=1 Tax=Oryza brachyantha TaxID=4533 RepID=J3MQR5_ORYBR